LFFKRDISKLREQISIDSDKFDKYIETMAEKLKFIEKENSYKSRQLERIQEKIAYKSLKIKLFEEKQATKDVQMRDVSFNDKKKPVQITSNKC
jgi:hypothetical protein